MLAARYLNSIYMNQCKCNCGQLVQKNWVRGHHRRGVKFSLTEKTKEKMRLSKLGSRNPRYGKPGTCLGRIQTPEQMEKIKIARSKQVITEEHKRKISLGLRRAYSDGKRKGEDSPFYIDGRHKGRTPIKQSYEYKLWRKTVFERDNYTCRDCKRRGGELQAHHIKPQSVFPELRFEINNGVTLCRHCHMKTDTFAMRTDKLKQLLRK